MKKGDKIIIRDSSYSKVVTAHGLESGYGHDELHHITEKYGIIIETGCKFPNPDENQGYYGTFNNTVVRTNSGKIVFIEERFLDLIESTHKIMVDLKQEGSIVLLSGTMYEISDELYKKIKHESQTQ